MAKGLLATQEAEYRRMAALRSAEASYREKQALREAAFAKEETPYAYMNFSMGPPQPGLVQTPKNPGLMGGPQYQSSDLPSGMTPEDVQKMLDYQRQAGTQEITAVPYNVGFRPGQPPTLLNQQQMPGAPMPRQLMQSSNAQLIGATPPTLPGKQQISIPGASPRPEFSADMLSGTQPIDSGQGRFNKNIPNQFGRSASPPMSIPRQQPTLSGKTIQPLPNQARTEPMIGQSMFEDNIIQGTLQNEGGIEEGDNHVANRGIDSRHHDIRTQDQKDNGVSNKQAIRDMSEEDAIALYKDKYWEHPRFDEINDVNVGRKVFDMGVNVGTPRATRMLQESLSELGYEHDGQGMGPGTSRAIDQAIADGKKDDLLRLLSEKQASHYVKLVHDNQDKYGPSMKGWLTRGLYESGNLGL